METNRQRLERRGDMDNSTLDKIQDDLGDRLCDYCPEQIFKEHGGILSSPDGPIMCEGRWCDEAMEAWLEDEADEDD